MQVLGIIPARGGSKGIPGKNQALLAGRPLIAYTFDAARASRTLTRTILTTDSEAIAALAHGTNIEVPFLRPAALAADDTPMIAVLHHALVALPGPRPDIVVLLQPTSPLRRAAHIDEAVELLQHSGADSVVSVVEVPHNFTPASLMRLESGRLYPLAANASLFRQEKPRLFARNGPAVLAMRAAVIESGQLYGPDTRPLVMDRGASLDIDDAFDLELAEALMAHQQ